MDEPNRKLVRINGVQFTADRVEVEFKQSYSHFSIGKYFTMSFHPSIENLTDIVHKFSVEEEFDITEFLTAIKPPMRWTNKPPTQPGIYWCKESNDIQPVHLTECGDGRGDLFVYTLGNEMVDLLSNYHSTGIYWYGPIEPPKE